MKKKILIVLAHPQIKSYCGALAQAYADGARDAGAEVRQTNLAEIAFNPVGSGSLGKRGPSGPRGYSQRCNAEQGRA